MTFKQPPTYAVRLAFVNKAHKIDCKTLKKTFLNSEVYTEELIVSKYYSKIWLI